MTYQTRSERRQNQKKRSSFKISMKNALPLAGTAMMVTPIVLASAPQNAQADEVGTYQANNLINQIGGAASQLGAQNDLYASVMIAQALLESANGTSRLASAPNYNLFGVKAYSGGPTVWLQTKEYLNGTWHTMTEPFRKYPSYYQSLVDHANVLLSQSQSTGGYRYSGAWRSNTTHYTQATAYLTGRYATDPGYAQKLNSIIQKYDLTRYDVGVSASSVANTAVSSTTQSAQQKVYTVVKGDTLWGIAQKFGVSVDQLISKNNISGELIVAGQQLSV